MAEEIKEEIAKDLNQSQDETAVSEESKANKEIAKDLNQIQVETTVSEESKANKKIESLESALRRFKRQSSGIISEVRKREAYDKPSVRRKKKSKEARRHQKNGRFNSSKW